jgi:hypothetical protein
LLTIAFAGGPSCFGADGGASDDPCPPPLANALCAESVTAAAIITILNILFLFLHRSPRTMQKKA